MPLKDISAALIESSTKDATSLNLLLEEIIPNIYPLILSKTNKNSEDSNDILQEILIRIYTNIKTLKDINSFPAWIKRITINQINTFYTTAKNKTTGNISLDDVEKYENNFADFFVKDRIIEKVQREQELIRFKKIAKRLPPQQRIAVSQLFINKKTNKEIANIMGISEGAVKYHIHKGKKKLMEFIECQ